MTYQMAMVATPFSPKSQTIRVNNDVLRTLDSQLALQSNPPERVQLELEMVDEYQGDLKRYARQIVWYGRKSMKMRPMRVQWFS